LDEAGEGKEKKQKIEALRQGWFWAERRWSQITEDTGIGNPKASTKEKGKHFFETITEKIADTFVELGKSNIDNMYEF
jgi:creatinine amidohydrolase